MGTGENTDYERGIASWKKFVSGDSDFFKHVFESYYPGLFGYGVKICNKPELVKDCIQELFINLWERRNKLSHIQSPNVYLFVSLRRNLLKKLKNKNKAHDQLRELKDVPHIAFGIEEILIKDETKKHRKKMLHEALSRLSNRQKEVLYLHFYHGMSYGEIEQILSVNRQSVRNYMYRAMENLRSTLSNEAVKLVVSLLLIFLFL